MFQATLKLGLTKLNQKTYQPEMLAMRKRHFLWKTDSHLQTKQLYWVCKRLERNEYGVEAKVGTTFNIASEMFHESLNMELQMEAFSGRSAKKVKRKKRIWHARVLLRAELTYWVCQQRKSHKQAASSKIQFCIERKI